MMIIRFVLVEPGVPENIGASARSIKTMGFTHLVLVNPCEWREGKSKWVAHGSEDILENAEVFASLAEAVDGSDLTISTSTRRRIIRQEPVAACDLRDFIHKKGKSVSVVSLVFGREESGLTNEEMGLCDVNSTIRMARQFPSLNLSHAVMIYAYELSGLKGLKQMRGKPADASSYRQLKDRTGMILDEMGIGITDNRHGRILERLSLLGESDINLLHTITGNLAGRLKGSG